MGRGGNYYSQCGQDWFVDYLFEQKEKGFYLDIGGNDPIMINNTYYFEKKGWNGIAFEPLAKYQSKWKDIRNVPCLPIALGKEEKRVSFVEMDQDALSGIKGINDKKIRFHWKKLGYKENREIVVQQRMLKNVLEEYGISEIDYVSLDVEGYELQVLEGIDFSKVEIKCFSIENEDGYKSIFKIRKFMVEKGYRLIARLGQDDIFVNTKFFWNLR